MQTIVHDLNKMQEGRFFIKKIEKSIYLWIIFEAKFENTFNTNKKKYKIDFLPKALLLNQNKIWC